MMDFIFNDIANLSTEELAQGDVIRRTEEVNECIEGAHLLGEDTSDCTHLVVITQSCDLVKRRLKAEHITLAAAKPFSVAMESYFRQNARSIDGSEFSYYPTRMQNQALQLVERHLNNTEKDFFFLPASYRHGISKDLAVYLRLTITLETNHYETLADAKIAELADVFRAKLGWLVGDMYSRVATPDLDEQGAKGSKMKKEFYDRYVRKDNIYWLTGLEAKRLGGAVKEERNRRARDLSREEVMHIVDKAPNHLQIVADNVVDRLIRRKLVKGSDQDLIKGIADAVVEE